MNKATSLAGDGSLDTGNGSDAGASLEKSAVKAKIIELYPKFRNLSKAAVACGYDPSTIYRWKADDPEFAEAISHCIPVIGDHYLELDEKIAENDKHPMSGTMAMFLTKRYHPEFRDNPVSTAPTQDNRQYNILITGNDPDAQKRVEQLLNGQLPQLDSGRQE